MLNLLRENAGTIAVLLVLAAIIAAIILYLVREKRSGRSGCGHGCESCALHGQCHRSGKE